MAQPQDADPVADAEGSHLADRVDDADNLMAGNDRQLEIGKSPSTT
jgi:hypothetical protein